MGSFIEINDTLQITKEQGFPANELNLDKILTDDEIKVLKSKTFSFDGKKAPRIFQLDPVRVYLVHNIDGKWLFWGKIAMESLAIKKVKGTSGDKPEDWVTSGTYRILDVYQGEYQKEFTKRESPEGKSFF